MEVCSNESPKAAVQQKPPLPTGDTPRPPLATSEKNNVVLPPNSKTRTREISSRYKSGITLPSISAIPAPKWCSSPTGSRASATPGTSVPKRAQSAERKRPPSTPSTRPSTPSSPSSRPSSPASRIPVLLSPSSRPSSPASRIPVLLSPSSRPSTPSSTSSRSTTPVHDSVVELQNSSRRSLSGRAPDGLWPSMRNLSSSFQSDSSSLLAGKRDIMVRNPSPDPALKSSATAVSERKRSPLRGRNISDHSENSRTVENSHGRMIDQHRWPGIMSGRVSGNSLSKSMDVTDKANRSASSLITTRGVSPTRRMPFFSDNSGSGLQKSTSEVARRVPSDGSNRVEGEMSSVVNVTSHPSDRGLVITRPNRSLSLPVPGLHHPSSPSKALSRSSSNSRGMQSPSRSRPSTPVSPSSSAATRVGVSSSVLNYIADVRTGKKSANHMEDAHQLRLLYNRDLQWRFVNARADAALSTQKITAENILYNVWNTTSELRDSVIVKRLNMQKLKHETKLDLILKEQIAYLEDWVALEKEHSSCLSGAFEALKASTLRLPVTGGARADMRAVKNAVSSAVDVMQAMGTSICSLLSRVEGTNRLVSELSNVAAKERDMLDECRELLASTAAMQVQECSLGTHLIQLRQDVA